MNVMKAVILERKGSEAAALAENGTFIKVRHAGDIGEEIDIAEHSAPIRIWRSGAAKFLTAAAIVLALIGGSYHYMAVSVSAYVSIDAGDSSVELTVNRLGRVTSVRPVAENSAELAKTLNVSISGMSVEDAVNAALDTIMEDGETVSDDEPVIVGITSESEGQAESLENAINDNAELPVRTVRVSDNEREEAHKQDIGGGAYVYGTEDVSKAVIMEQSEDIAPIATEDEAKVIPVFEIEQTAIETRETTAEEMPQVTENADITEPAEIRQELPAVTASAEQQSIPEIPHQSEQFSGNIQQDRPGTQNNTAPDVGMENPPQQNEQQENILSEQPGEQIGQGQEFPAPGEGDVPPQSGQQPDNMPPEPSGEQNGQGPEISLPDENMQQAQPPEMSGTAKSSAMPAPDTFGQR